MIYFIIAQCVPVYYIRARYFMDEFEFTDTVKEQKKKAFPAVKDGIAITMVLQYKNNLPFLFGTKTLSFLSPTLLIWRM